MWLMNTREEISNIVFKIERDDTRVLPSTLIVYVTLTPVW